MAPNEALLAWLGEQEIPAAEFARRIDYDRSNLHNILAGYIRPSLPLALRIEQETSGDIPMALWADMEPKARPKKAAA